MMLKLRPNLDVVTRNISVCVMFILLHLCMLQFKTCELLYFDHGPGRVSYVPNTISIR